MLTDPAMAPRVLRSKEFGQDEILRPIADARNIKVEFADGSLADEDGCASIIVFCARTKQVAVGFHDAGDIREDFQLRMAQLFPSRFSGDVKFFVQGGGDPLSDYLAILKSMQVPESQIVLRDFKSHVEFDSANGKVRYY